MKISYVIPCYNSERTLSRVVDEIKKTMETQKKYSYEIILVNDGSEDNTIDAIRRLCTENDMITGIDMAKNFGQHAALMAGLNCAIGDVMVCLDDDGQSPANEVFKLIEKIEAGYDVVYANYENKKHSPFRNFGSKVNGIMAEKMLGKPKKLYVSSYFAVRRFVVEEMVKYQNAYPYVIGLILRTTKNICNVNVNHRKREVGKTGYTFKKLLALWINGFTAFSEKPLRVATIAGVLVAMCGAGFTIWTIVNKMTNPNVPLGWSSTIAVILFVGGMILVVLGMIGEYIGRIYICLNKSPQYVVREVIGNGKVE